MQTASPGDGGARFANAGTGGIASAAGGVAGNVTAGAMSAELAGNAGVAGEVANALGGAAGMSGVGGTGGNVSGAGGAQPTGGAVNADCPAGASICESFEQYASGATDLSPSWTTYSYQGGQVRVDQAKPFTGAQSLHLNTAAGMRHYADIVKINPPTQPLFPNHHFGRAMVWLTTVPSQAHFLVNHASGPLAADPTTVAKYSYGGHLGQFEPTYSQKMPVGGVEHPALRGGGPELGDPFPAPVDCQRTATTEPVPTKRWLCWEWSFDADKSETYLWIDGQAMTQVDFSAQTPGSCKTVQGPKLFNKLVIGWEVYTAASEVDQEAFIDDLVIGDARVGCPAPP